jgi:hypothetical protein
MDVDEQPRYGSFPGMHDPGGYDEFVEEAGRYQHQEPEPLPEITVGENTA